MKRNVWSGTVKYKCTPLDPNEKEELVEARINIDTRLTEDEVKK